MMTDFHSDSLAQSSRLPMVSSRPSNGRLLADAGATGGGPVPRWQWM